jgi:succinyl-diaminopimelate desuccinylase
MVERITHWLHNHAVPVSVLSGNDRRPVAVVGEVRGNAPGPTYCLDACLDTAPFGALTAWNHPPTAPHIADGWLYGRGAADSKVAVAIFSHVAADFQLRRSEFRGRLLVLFDADEHTGHFAGVKTFLGCARTTLIAIQRSGAGQSRAVRQDRAQRAAQRHP